MSDRAADRIRRDLEQRGVAREFSARLSQRLQPIVEPLDPEAYEAVLSSVSHACRAQTVQAVPPPDLPDPTSLRGLEEVQRLLGAFTDELQKLEEALETLAAYVTRMRSQTVHSRGQTLH